jgi:hypothetical protein
MTRRPLTIPNPSQPGGLAPAAMVTDRALRYRANANPPAGPELCHYCGAAGRCDIDHVDGREEHGNPENLAYACRSCNTRKGAYFAAAGLGRKTRQLNPRQSKAARTIVQYASAVGALMGIKTALSPSQAIATVQATNPEARARFAQQLQARAANPEHVPTYEQYKWAVKHHDKKTKAHDEGGAVIHATPKKLRKEYASRIAAEKSRAGTNRRPAEPLDRWE